MRVLLAGGGGFIGSCMARRFLEAGHCVVVVDNFITGRRANVEALVRGRHGCRFEFLRADICRRPRISGPVDAVLHLASPASPIDYLRYPIETLDAGSLGTKWLLELALRHDARFLLASTSEIYGDPKVHPQTEAYWGNVNPVGPRSVYDEAKRYSEALASAYARHHGLPVRIIRIFNTYGPRMRLDDGRVIPTFVAQALLDRPITVFGDGSQTRSYCFVEDLAEGLERLLWSDLEDPVNLGNPEEFTVLETARRVIALVGSKSGVEGRWRSRRRLVWQFGERRHRVLLPRTWRGVRWRAPQRRRGIRRGPRLQLRLRIAGWCGRDGHTTAPLVGIRVSPNPTSRMAAIRWTVPAAIAGIDVYNVQGRRVRKLDVAGEAGGVEWDLRDESGKRVAQGIYLIAARSRGGAPLPVHVAPLAVLR